MQRVDEWALRCADGARNAIQWTKATVNLGLKEQAARMCSTPASPTKWPRCSRRTISKPCALSRKNANPNSRATEMLELPAVDQRYLEAVETLPRTALLRAAAGAAAAR